MTKNFDVEKIECDIEVRENIDHHIRAWKLRKVGKIVMVAFILCALLGLFGNGPLSNRTRTSNNDTLRYEYFTRYQSNTELDFNLYNLSDITRIAFPQQYLKSFRIEAIFPEPEDNRIANDTVTYFFKTAAKGSIRFYLMPQERGHIEGNVVVNDKKFDLSHFIFP